MLFFYDVHYPIIFWELKVKSGDDNLMKSENLKKAYFAGGCFWCMEEAFDKIDGVKKSISGYSGGHFKNPTYNDVIYKDTGHVETIEITFDPKRFLLMNY